MVTFDQFLEIDTFMSDVLALGAPDDEGRVILLHPDQEVPLGGRIA